VDHKARYRDVQEKLALDPRFAALDSDRERGDMFEDLVMGLEKKEKERLKLNRADNLAAFRTLLEETDTINARTRWGEAKTLLKEDERYQGLEGDDKYRLENFDDYIQGLVAKEAEQKEMERERKKAIEKAQRQAFSELLAEMEEKGILTLKSTYKEAKETEEAKNEARWEEMMAQSKTKTQDLVDDFILELQKKFQANRTTLKEAYKAAEKLDITTCGLEAFGAALRAFPSAEAICDLHIKMFHEELVKLAEEEMAKKEKKKLVKVKELKKLLDKYIGREKITLESTFEEAEAACGERSAWKEISSGDRASSFISAMATLKKEEAEASGASRSRSRSRSGSREHRRRSRSGERRREDSPLRRNK